ncbi:MAG: hypothetical protein ABIA04_02550 [Pseudomonadota bacterium]
MRNSKILWLFIILSSLNLFFTNSFSATQKWEKDALSILNNPNSTAEQISEALDLYVPGRRITGEHIDALSDLVERIDIYDPEQRPVYRKFINTIIHYTTIQEFEWLISELNTSEDLLLVALTVSEVYLETGINHILGQSEKIRQAKTEDVDFYEDFVQGKETQASELVSELFRNMGMEVPNYGLRDLIIIASQLQAIKTLHERRMMPDKSLVLVELLHASSPFDEVRQKTKEALINSPQLSNRALLDILDKLEEGQDQDLKDFIQRKLIENRLRLFFDDINRAYKEAVSARLKAYKTQKGRVFVDPEGGIEFLLSPEGFKIPVRAVRDNYEETRRILEAREADPVVILSLAIDRYLMIYKSSFGAETSAFFETRHGELTDIVLIMLENYRSARVRYLALDILHRYILNPKDMTQENRSYNPSVEDSNRQERIEEAKRIRLTTALAGIMGIPESDLSFQARSLLVLMSPQRQSPGEFKFWTRILFVDGMVNKLKYFGDGYVEASVGLGGNEIQALLNTVNEMHRLGQLKDLEVRQVAFWVKEVLMFREALPDAIFAHEKFILASTAKRLLEAKSSDLKTFKDPSLRTLASKVFAESFLIDVFNGNHGARNISEPSQIPRLSETDHRDPIGLEAIAQGELADPIDLDPRTLASAKAEEIGVRAPKEVVSLGTAEEIAKTALEVRARGYGEREPGKVKK